MISVKSLTKHYGNLAALQDVGFTIDEGEVVGLLGLNGAGKTTCLRILSGYLIPSGGEYRIANIDAFANPLQVKSKIGYLPETPPLYPELTVEDYLLFVARLRGVPAEQMEGEFERVMALTHLNSTGKALIRHLSLGYRKRVGIAQALMGSPSILIMDEPITGLDPVQIIEIRKLIRKLAGKYTILISSHILTEVSRTCDRVIIIHNGRLTGELQGEGLQNNLEEQFMQITGG